MGCLVFLGTVFSFIKLFSSTDTSTKRGKGGGHFEKLCFRYNHLARCVTWPNLYIVMTTDFIRHIGVPSTEWMLLVLTYTWDILYDILALLAKKFNFCHHGQLVQCKQICVFSVKNKVKNMYLESMWLDYGLRGSLNLALLLLASTEDTFESITCRFPFCSYTSARECHSISLLVAV